jgi:hypothetical protein
MTVGNNSAFQVPLQGNDCISKRRYKLMPVLQEKTKSAEILYGLGCDPLRSGIIMYCHLKQYMYDYPACSTATNGFVPMFEVNRAVSKNV